MTVGKEARSAQFKRRDGKQCAGEHAKEREHDRHHGESKGALQRRLAVLEGSGDAAEEEQKRKQSKDAHGLPDKILGERGVDGCLGPSTNAEHTKGADCRQ